MNYRPNNKQLKILTDTGYQDFSGIAYLGDKNIYRVEFDDNWIECTNDHQIYISNTTKIDVSKLSIGDTVLAKAGSIKVTSIINTGRTEAVYDVIDVNNGHKFYGNNILVSNCEFISFDETLINSMFLHGMSLGIDPVNKTGQVRWYDKITNGPTYIISLDPSLGTGGDPAAIQIFSIPGMKQVGEWQHNKTPIQTQIKILRDILIYIEDSAPMSEIYYSVENNTIGEASLISIKEMGEENIPGIFLSEPRRKGNSRVYRKGFNTTNSNKLSACAKLKRWVEEERMLILSKNLTRELKTFVAVGNSFKAKPGETDDLVMSTILAVRMAMQISKYDEEAFLDLKDSFDETELLQPMPIGVL